MKRPRTLRLLTFSIFAMCCNASCWPVAAAVHRHRVCCNRFVWRRKSTETHTGTSNYRTSTDEVNRRGHVIHCILLAGMFIYGMVVILVTVTVLIRALVVITLMRVSDVLSAHHRLHAAHPHHSQHHLRCCHHQTTVVRAWIEGFSVPNSSRSR